MPAIKLYLLCTVLKNLPQPKICELHTDVYKQDRQCTYNITLRHVPATIVAMEK